MLTGAKIGDPIKVWENHINSLLGSGNAVQLYIDLRNEIDRVNSEIIRRSHLRHQIEMISEIIELEMDIAMRRFTRSGRNY